MDKDNLRDCRNSFTPKETLDLRALKDVLRRYGVPSFHFSAEGYQEFCVCLSKKGRFWGVYYAERGQRFDEVRYRDFATACVGVIEKLVDPAACYSATEAFRMKREALAVRDSFSGCRGRAAASMSMRASSRIAQARKKSAAEKSRRLVTSGK